MTTYGMDVQLQIYAKLTNDSVEGVLPVSFEEWEQLARKKLADGPWGYVAGGAGSEDTMRANREAFYAWRIRPRMLRDVSDRDLTVSLYGRTLPAPVLLGPIGVQSIIHAEAELASARAAAEMGVPFVLSTVSSVALEQVAEVMGNAARWFQLYPGKNRDVIASLICRAEKSGYEAIVVTLDTTMLAWRDRDLRNAYLPFLQGEGIANFIGDPAFRSLLQKAPEEDMQSAILQFLHVYVNPAFTWRDLAFIRKQTKLPILLKGITHPDDAKQGLEYGVDGIVVSNHGGRQVDGAVAALDALPEVLDAVQGRVPVLMDSGIRRAADVLKAMALGASSVLIGRPYAYALAAGGQKGVSLYLRNLLAELDLEIALSGLKAISEADLSVLTRV
ncbi:alpha-hydroxy-acid oxidizing protein [Alicyclobacillus tolerans]|uniref:alpha-hydroxy-acid oxidizing protein n=1 Tax=Alicyclobacillus tolerans TaxID=90970 RepID=UPI001F00947C|nr:alpha-hydroxy-acid oxidizing protein [Alicyclobacillus tolerans]MCF8566766.1 alpha-hydroxy-acid oxidizing protein [Alicyclobacillus tolerans]